jgi:hypothetical protein
LGSLIFNSTDVSSTDKIAFRITSTGAMPELTSNLENFFGSINFFDIPTASVILVDSLWSPAIDLPRGGFIPKWLLCLVLLSVVTAIFLYLRRRYKPTKLIYIFYAIIIFMVLVGCAFTG